MAQIAFRPQHSILCLTYNINSHDTQHGSALAKAAEMALLCAA